MIVNSVINKDIKELNTYKIYSIENDIKLIDKYESKK